MPCIIAMETCIKKIDIQIKDSVKIINMPLKKNGKSFKLDVEK